MLLLLLLLEDDEGGSFPVNLLRMSCRKMSLLDPRLSFFFFSFVVVVGIEVLPGPLSFPSIEFRCELSLLLKVTLLALLLMLLLFVLSPLLDVNPRPSPPDRPPPPCPPPLPAPHPNPSAATTASPVPPKTPSVTVITVASAGLAHSVFRLRGVRLNIEKDGIFSAREERRTRDDMRRLDLRPQRSH